MQRDKVYWKRTAKKIRRFLIAGLLVPACLLSACGNTKAASQKTMTLLEQEIAKGSTAEYDGTEWIIDSDAAELPEGFRTMQSVFGKAKDKYKMDANYVPSRQGMEQCRMSGSAQFSLDGLRLLAAEIKKQSDGSVYIVDLRQESHGFLNGTAVSWYGKNDWSNLGMTREEVLADEKERLQNTVGKQTEICTLDGEKNADEKRTIETVQALTEEDAVKNEGLQYFRITATDHAWPEPECIDAFIEFVKELPRDSWLHFHCAGGVGRTVEFMAMYDMICNPDVSLKDIEYRQCLLGGNYLGYRPADGQAGWKTPYYNEKADMAEKFYAYVQDEAADGFAVSWSEWLL